MLIVSSLKFFTTASRMSIIIWVIIDLFVKFFIIRPKCNINISVSFTTVKFDIQKYCGLCCPLGLSDQATNALIVQTFPSDIVT